MPTYKPGDKVRVIKDFANYANHPTEPRDVMCGDIITVNTVGEKQIYFLVTKLGKGVKHYITFDNIEPYQEPDDAPGAANSTHLCRCEITLLLREGCKCFGR